MVNQASGSLTSSIELLRTHGPSELRKVLENELRLGGSKAIVGKLVQLIEASSEQSRVLEDIKLQLSVLDIDVVNSSLVKNMFADRIVLDATQAFSGEQGLSTLEYDGKGMPYRWSGGNDGVSLFTVNIDRSVARTVTVTFLIAEAIHDEMAAGSILGFLDGRQVNFTQKTLGEHMLFMTDIEALEKNHPTELKLNIPTWVPDEIDGSGDLRTLGWPFVSLTVE